MIDTVASYCSKLDRKLYTQMDSSKIGLIAELFRKFYGHERIIAVISRYLTIYEMNYSIMKLELLVLVYALLKRYKYLLRTTFEIITDHLASTFFLNSFLQLKPVQMDSNNSKLVIPD